MSYFKNFLHLVVTLQCLSFVIISNFLKQLSLCSRYFFIFFVETVHFVTSVVYLSENYTDYHIKRYFLCVICIVLISFLQQASKDTHPKSFVQYYGITLLNLMHLFNEMYFALRIVEFEVIQEDKTLLIVGLVLEASWKLFVLNELSCANLIKLCHMLLIIYILSRLVTPTECFFMSIKVFGQGLFCLFLLRAKKESLEKEKNQRKSLNKNKTRDFKTLVEILDHLSEGITLFDSKGEIKFVNSHLKRILDFEKKLTMDNLNVTLSDLKFSHSFLKNLRNISKEEQINAKKARSHDLVEETSESFDEVDFSKEKLKNVSCFWDLFTLYTKNSETGSAISNYTNFFQARYYHKFTHEWRNIELQAHLLQSNNEKQLLILIKDLSEFDIKTHSLEKEKLLYRDNLIASFSHELRTPLNSNLGFLEQSMDSPLIPSEAKEKYIRPALVSGRLLFFMVSDILDYSLILANGLRLNYKPQSVLKTINDCFEIIQPKFIEKNLRLHLTLEGNIPPYTNTDHKRLSQILINLLNNSLQFTMKGEVEINVTRVSCGKLLISVKDTGIGMDKETQVKLESNLAKDYIDEKANHNSIGIGLGLFISNKLAKILNPDSQKGVKFVSSKNFGSVFYFEVKDYQQQRHDLSPKRLSGLEIEPHLNLNVKLRQYDTKKLKNCFRESLKGSYMNSLDKVQLLIVDDEIFNIIVLENFCKALGVKTEKALNGQEAIEKLKLSPKNSYSSIKVIFMDINMPIMDGYQATREIHNLVEKGEIEDVTVIGVTAYISWDKIEKGYRSGMTEILNKPVSKETILNVLTKYKIL